MDESILPPPYVPKENGEESARLFFEKLRWPQGKPVCPACGSQHPIYKQTRQGVAGYYRCPAPHPHPSGQPKPFVFTVRTGTILARSHVALDKWLYCFGWYGYMRSTFWIPPISVVARTIGVNRKTAASLMDVLWDLRFHNRVDDQANEFLLGLMRSLVQEKRLLTQ